MKKSSIYLLILVIVVGAGYGLFEYNKTRQKKFNDTVNSLQKQISGLSSQLAQISRQQATSTALSEQEIANRGDIRAKSQDELLTAAVAKVSPAVVSIVISKDVPKLEVTYVNPFGDDPFFQDFGARVPVYRQNGTEKQQVGAGTGFLISSDGYILTNKHVVYDDAASYTVLLSDGSQKDAKVIYKDPVQDVAIVKISGSNYKAITLGDSSQLKLGQSVFAVGNALGEYNNSVSVGIISGLNRSIEAASQTGSEQLSGVIQTDAAINPGNSGGPLSDLDGNVMGINVATVQGSNNISFAIPINQVKQIIKTVLGNR